MSRDVFVSPAEVRRQQRRVRAFAVVVLAGLAALALRLWQIQVVDHARYARLAAMQSSRTRLRLPERGLLLDRGGRLLVDNQPGMRLRLFPERMTQAAATVAFLTRTLGDSPADVTDRVLAASRRRPFRPETLVEQLDRDDLARIGVHLWAWPELDIETAPLRRYPHGTLAAHVFGYLGEIDDDELAAQSALGLYAQGDIIGKSGVEHTYDTWLFGTKGREVYRVDANGRVQELLDAQPARPGWDLLLTIDLPTQQAAEAALAERRGAVVAIDPRDGDVLAIVSHPGFDPALFVGGIRSEPWARLRDDPGHPLEYRPVRGVYPPGSTFKPFVALAGLEAGIIDEDWSVFCPGSYRLGNRTFRCWKATGHGRISLHRAIVESCDAYFYEVGRRLGIDRMARFMRGFGFGLPTGLDLAGEKGGLMPDPDWKQRTGRGRWNEGETIIAAIGQGSVLATPLQMARAYAAIGSGGSLVTPHLRERFAPHDRPAPRPAPEQPDSASLAVSPRHLALVQSALEGVVHEPHGTGYWARIKNTRVAGKTGTAQVVRQDVRDKELAERLRDHAWFVAYAPATDPRIAVAVIVENGGHGGDAAAPVARRVIEAYLQP